MRVMRLGREVDYQEAWALQRRLHDEVVAGGEDALLLLEHASVYTAGTSTRDTDLPTDGSPVVHVDRGGRITWHGPGQLVAYPIVAIGDLGVVDWVRRLEQAILDALRPLGLDVDRVRGRAGVWLRGDGTPFSRDRKIAQVGVRVAGGVSTHGIAINVAPDLAAFARIVPCGITDAGVTSIAVELDSAPTVEQVGDAFADALLALGVAAVGAPVEAAAAPAAAPVSAPAPVSADASASARASLEVAA